jgi:hypothetical protein
MELKSDLSNVKVGDKVFCTVYGWGIVTDICYNSYFPIKVNNTNEYTSYTLDGKISSNANLPSLFIYNPFNQIVFEPRWMMVSMDMISWVKRFVIYKTSYFIALYNAENEEQVKNETSTTSWKYAKEIEEIEFSMEEALEELAKLKGIDKSLIKIKL